VELFEAIQILDGRVILCELGLPIWDMLAEDLMEGVEVMMASTFLFEAEGAKLSFSY
jgi:predicted peroxiredoxin